MYINISMPLNIDKTVMEHPENPKLKLDQYIIYNKLNYRNFTEENLDK